MKDLTVTSVEKVFHKFNPYREHGKPVWSWEQWLQTRDGVNIYSWWYDNNRSNHNGTLFVLHGFTANCGNPQYWDKPKQLADNYGFCLGEIDFRFHGKSGNKLPTFGLAESWDVEAALNYADENNFPKPYILIGESFGGMAAQVTAITDSRVYAAICLQTPAWPWDAIGVVGFEKLKKYLILHKIPILLFGTTINRAYGRDILKEGDIRTKEPNPRHQPYVLYIMAKQDKFHIEHTHAIWDHWYKGNPADYTTSPTQSPNQRKWFLICPGDHAEDNGGPSVMSWDKLEEHVIEFLDHVMRRVVVSQRLV